MGQRRKLSLPGPHREVSNLALSGAGRKQLCVVFRVALLIAVTHLAFMGYLLLLQEPPTSPLFLRISTSGYSSLPGLMTDRMPSSEQHLCTQYQTTMCTHRSRHTCITEKDSGIRLSPSSGNQPPLDLHPSPHVLTLCGCTQWFPQVTKSSKC